MYRNVILGFLGFLIGPTSFFRVATLIIIALAVTFESDVLI